MTDNLKHFSTETLFARGNYAEVARRNETDRWQTYAAKGLIGLFAEAHEGLARFDDPKIPFYYAAILWLEGKEEDSERVLTKIDTVEARKLLSLIRKKQIRVLAQLSWTRVGSQDVLSGITKDSRFAVDNISFDQRDLPNEPYADIRKYFSPNTPPDFFVSEMVEWHLTPPNLQALPCPIIGQTSDYDLHIQALPPWLRLFDFFVAGDHEEWFDVGRISGGAPIFTFPKFVGVPDDLPNVPENDRPLDFFISGTVHHPFWPEKTKAVFELLSMRDVEFRIMQGFLPHDLYQFLLGYSKTSFSSLRHPSAMPSRSLEALSMGCAVVLQEESVLGLYFSEREGLFSYGESSRSHVDAVLQVINNWKEVHKAAIRGMKRVRREFSLSVVASQYFRFLTYLSCLPRPPRKAIDPSSLVQKRLVLNTGFLPSDNRVLTQMWKSNVARIKPESGRDVSPKAVIDITREIMIYIQAEGSDELREQSKQLFQLMFSFFKSGIEKFPKSIVLRFNYMRALYHFGSHEDITLSMMIGKEIIDMDPAQWDIDVDDDVLPWDFHKDRFNYRSYFDAITQQLVSGESCRDSLVGLIVASTCCYVGGHENDIHLLARAWKTDPNFAYYQMAYVRALRITPRRTDEEILMHLMSLAQGSVVFDQALLDLEEHQLKAVSTSYDILRLRQVLLAMIKNTTDINKTNEQFGREFLQIKSQSDSPNLPYAQRRFGDRRKGPARNISLFYLDDGNEDDTISSLRIIKRQATVDRLECFICTKRDSIKLKELVRSTTDADIKFHLMEFGNAANTATMLNTCIDHCRGELLTLVPPRTFLRPNACALLAEQLLSKDNALLAYGDLRIQRAVRSSTKRNGTMQWERYYYRRPSFAEHRQRFDMSLTHGTLWRREIHDKIGFFDPAEGEAALFGFFMRLALAGEFTHLQQSVATVFLDLEDDPSAIFWNHTPEAIAKRRALWPAGWGKPPMKSDDSPTLIPAKLAGAISTEAGWLVDWELVDEKDAFEQVTWSTLAREMILRSDNLLAEIILHLATTRAKPLTTSCLMLSELLRLKGDGSGYLAMRALAQKQAMRILAPQEQTTVMR